MPEAIPQEFPTPDRDDLIERYKRDVRFYSDGAQATDEGTQPDIDAKVLADQVVPMFLQIRTEGDNLVLTTSTGDATETWATSSGLEGRTPATGASGFVVIEAATGGTTIFAGDELKPTSTNLRFKCSATGTYDDGDTVPIEGIDTGPSTNLAAGTVLEWTAPRPGCGSTATVWEDSEGNGLTGGRLEETDDELIDRIIDTKKNPPASGNVAHYLKLIKATPGLAVQQGFAYPAISGPGSIALVFTMQPTTQGGSRIPNAAQIAQVEAWLQSQVPEDDSFDLCTLLASALDVAIEVSWQDGADGWADLTPWPPYYAGNDCIKVSAFTSATSFTLSRASADYTGVAQPQVGQTIAFYNGADKTFVKKRILSVGGSGPWVITCDTTANASNTTFTPSIGDKAMPWSESLSLVLTPIQDYFATLGPGEQVESFFDAGSRQRRQPQPPAQWPSVFGARAINGVQDLDAVADADLLEPTTPYPTPTGTAAVVSRLLSLNTLAVYAQT